MTRTAIVKEIRDGKTYVVADRESACENCHSKDACINNCKPIVAEAINDIGAKAGERVEISTSDGRVLLYAFLTFFVPIILGVAAFFLLPFSETIKYIIVTLVIILSLGVMAFTANLRTKKNHVSRISAILEPPAGNSGRFQKNGADVEKNESENIDNEKSQKMEHIIR